MAMDYDEALPWHETTEQVWRRGRGLARKVLLWSWVLIGVTAVVVVFIALHVVPSAGAAGGCGGG
jgi:hypothetical protein